MCMMAKNGEQESCEVAKNLAALGVRVTDVEKRQTSLEGTVSDMRRESQDGFKSLSSAINTLGHDFGDRMNIIEKKVVDEKAEWGKSFRRWVDWIVKLLIVGCGTAMGVTGYKIIFGG